VWFSLLNYLLFVIESAIFLKVIYLWKTAMAIDLGDFNFKDGKLYEGRYQSSSDLLGNIQGFVIYRGRYNNSSDIVGNIKGDTIYRGRYQNSSDVLGIVKNGKVFRGRYESSSAQVACFDKGSLYEGKYPSNSQKMGVIPGTEYMSPVAITALIHFFIHPLF